jgi:hypothetical protein
VLINGIRQTQCVGKDNQGIKALQKVNKTVLKATLNHCKNITLTGVNLSATDGDINLTANNNVNIKAALENHSLLNECQLHPR